ncbi:MAG: hypothetical protein ACOC1F_10530 [Myxococcota bacterium]
MPPSTGGGRLTPQDLGYVGAFRLPEAFDWGARGLAYHHQGTGVLLVTGHDQRPAEFAPVAIPQPARARHPAQLPLAQMLSPVRSFDGNIVEGITDTAFASGIEVVPRRGAQRSDKLYGSLDRWYGVVEETHSTVWFSELDGSSPRGPFHVGPRNPAFHGNQSGAFLFQVPPDYAARYLGGRTLMTGKTRGAFHGSQGPALFAFAPFDQEAPSGDLDAVKMLGYRLKFPACAGPNVGDPRACDCPGFTMCDQWEGASFVNTPTRNAILFVGRKGLGPNRYGNPPPGACGESKGYHCDPFERQVLFYDVDELGAVALGQRPSWSVLPYAVWKPAEFLLQGHTCGEVGGMAYDPHGRRLFIIERGIGDNNGAVVHVWHAVR